MMLAVSLCPRHYKAILRGREWRDFLEIFGDAALVKVVEEEGQPLRHSGPSVSENLSNAALVFSLMILLSFGLLIISTRLNLIGTYIQSIMTRSIK